MTRCTCQGARPDDICRSHQCHQENGVGCRSTSLKASAASAASIELCETIRDTSGTITKGIAAPNPTCQHTASNTPKPVAADFSPENRMKIDLLCPKIASSAAAITDQGNQTSNSTAASPAATTTASEKSDWANAKVLPDDKGYDSDWLRVALPQRKILAYIPSKSNRKVPIAQDLPLYRQRRKVENMFGRIKDWRRIYMRYDHCAHTFMSATLMIGGLATGRSA